MSRPKKACLREPIVHGTKARTETSRFESKLLAQDSSLLGSSCASNFRLVTATVQHEQRNVILFSVYLKNKAILKV